VSYALQGIDVKQWGLCLLKTISRIKEILHLTGFNLEDINEELSLFESKWNGYMIFRINDKLSFPPNYNFSERDSIYNSLFLLGREQDSDVTLIAYDSLLWASQFYDHNVMVTRQTFFNDGSKAWFELIQHSAMFKGQHTCAAATLASAWYGAQNGLRGIPVQNYKSLDIVWKLQNIGGAMESVSYRV